MTKCDHEWRLVSRTKAGDIIYVTYVCVRCGETKNEVEHT